MGKAATPHQEVSLWAVVKAYAHDVWRHWKWLAVSGLLTAVSAGQAVRSFVLPVGVTLVFAFAALVVAQFLAYRDVRRQVYSLGAELEEQAQAASVAIDHQQLIQEIAYLIGEGNRLRVRFLSIDREGEDTPEYDAAKAAAEDWGDRAEDLLTEEAPQFVPIFRNDSDWPSSSYADHTNEFTWWVHWIDVRKNRLDEIMQRLGS